MPKFVRKLLRRTTVVALLIALQGYVLIQAVLRLSSHFVYVYAAFELISLLAVLWIIGRQDNPSYKLAWIVPILLFPVFGGLFYLMFGGHRVPRTMLRRVRQSYTDSAGQLCPDPAAQAWLQQCSPGAACQSDYIQRQAGFPACAGTAVRYFPTGEAKFAALLEDLRRARHFIYLEYFIIQPGQMWDPILAILEEKAAAGLDVRVVYDDIGCAYTLPGKYRETLRAKGIRCHVFNPFRPVMSMLMNNRDHRKIVSIDGWVGYTGGVNLADEYINVTHPHGRWKDSAVRLEGEAVWSLTVMFLRMWDYLDGSRSDFAACRPHVWHPAPFEGAGVVQPYGDSPLDNETVGENVYLGIIGRATRYVWITSPYLIVDNEMVTALCLAAKSGVDVRIITPHVADKWYVHLVTQAHYQQLLEAGVRIYEFTPGFIHAKSFVCDDCVATVGTINLDYRSLYLHFECGVWMYGTPCIADIRQDFLDTLAVSQEVPSGFSGGISLAKRLVRALLRLLSPLM